MYKVKPKSDVHLMDHGSWDCTRRVSAQVPLASFCLRSPEAPNPYKGALERTLGRAQKRQEGRIYIGLCLL